MSMSYWRNGLYVIGGSGIGGQNSQGFTDHTLYKFDLSTGYWETLKVSKPIDMIYGAGMATYKDSLYLFPGFSNEQGIDTLTTYRLDLTASNYDWEILQYDPSSAGNIPFDSYAFDFIGSTAYFACGWSTILHNSFITVDVSVRPLNYKKLARDYISPSPRKNHSLIQFGNQLYLFGGEGKNSK